MSRPSQLTARLALRCALALLAITSLLSCDACPAVPSTAPREPLASDAGPADEIEFITEDEYEILPVDPRYYPTDGHTDVGNRYSFTVMIGASLGAREHINCSGIIINPFLVLTAGHCVCGAHPATPPESKAHSIIDGSRCAGTAELDTVIYSPTDHHPAILMNERFRTYSGKVRPHPSLEILLDEQATPISNRADLAVIVMDEPIEGVLPAVHLPTSEAKPGEVITIAGYGFDGKSDLILGRRRFGRKKLTRFATSGGEGILFEQVGDLFISGSGEACLRQSQRGIELVGITVMPLKEGPACISTWTHREWILSEICRALPRKKTPSKQ
jgi:hypothetical protein